METYRQAFLSSDKHLVFTKKEISQADKHRYMQTYSKTDRQRHI